MCGQEGEWMNGRKEGPLLLCGKMNGGFSRMRLLMVLFVHVIPG